MEKATSGLAELKLTEDPGADRKILIAVDFGTTFSGVAWAQTRRVRPVLIAAYPRVLTCNSLMYKQLSFSGLIQLHEDSKV